MSRAEEFEELRPLLFAIAYRILGMSDAEWDSGPAVGALPSARLATAPTVA